MNFLISPFEQFEIYIISPILLPNLLLTNYLFYTLFCIFILCFIFVYTPKIFKYRLVSISAIQSISERLYVFIFEFIYQQVGFIAQQFLPLFFGLFLFIVTANFMGLIPYSFTLTSHIALTFLLSFSVFIGLTILAIIYQPNFFDLFLPKGIPAALVPFLFVIELISYISRTFSLAIRLFANMMSGHVLLYILTGFCAYLINSCTWLGGLGAVFPFYLITGILVLETGIAFLQAYVFCILVSIYLSDVYSCGH